MKLGPTPTTIYTRQQFTDYQVRLTNTLMNEGLTALDISNNTGYKEYVAKWVDEECIKKEIKLKLEGKIRRLNNMYITAANQTEEINYPIVNEYKGHDLVRSFYFKLEDGHITTGTVDVIPGSSGVLLVL